MADIRLSFNQFHSSFNMFFEKHKGVLIYWLYGGLIAINETIITIFNIQIGFSLHVLLFCVLLAHFYRTYKTDANWLLLAITLVPLIRILSLSIPLEDMSIIFWYPVIGIPLWVYSFTITKLAGFNFSQLGLKIKHAPTQLIISLIGLPLGLLGYLILKPDTIYSYFSVTEVCLSIIILVIFTGFLEEFIFRGLMFQAALQAMGNQKAALIFISFLSAVLQISNGSFLYPIYAFLVSIIFTRVYIWQKSIIGLSLAHGLFNISLYLISRYTF